ncbi:hypothetical protein FA13DRAFT_1719161 [Coprinellus micaceus]|uniref:Uncharacterized protein n=1 Tax=Coprinellus micaceus TaxID=71717 RepID=A0A4Y7SBM7_COPMI|nr:hypothetical protein FA13DRAFT_1719161 [Coprinellus micaceus]
MSSPRLTSFFSVISATDVRRRRGLKQLNATLESTLRKLEDAYASFCLTLPEHFGVRAGVISLYTMVAADSVLCDKISRDDNIDIIGKSLSLLHTDATRHLSLRLLALLVRNGSAEIRRKLLLPSHLAILSDIVECYPNDETLRDLVVANLCQYFVGIPKIYLEIEIESAIAMLGAFIKCIAIPGAPRSCVVDGVSAMTVLLGAKRSKEWREKLVRACPETLGILVAGIRSPTWACRATCLNTLLAIYGVVGFKVWDLKPEVSPVEDPTFRYLATLSSLPEKLCGKEISRAVVTCPQGWELCPSYVAAQVPWRLMAAFRDYRQNKDAIGLGRALYDLIVSTEFAIPDIAEHGGLYGSDPFPNYVEALEYCAHRLRRLGDRHRGDQVKAAILDITAKIKRGLFQEACAEAKRAIANFLYAAYIRLLYILLNTNAGPMEAMDKVVLARRCEDESATPFVQMKLLAIEAEKAALAGIDKLMQAQCKKNPSWAWGHSLLAVAGEDAQEFLRVAPLLHLDRSCVFSWYLICVLVLSTHVCPDNWGDSREFFNTHLGAYIAFCDKGLAIDPHQRPISRLMLLLIETFPMILKQYERVFECLGDGTPLEGLDITDTGKLLDKAVELEIKRRAREGSSRRDQSDGNASTGSLEVNSDNLFCVYPRVSPNPVKLGACSYCAKRTALIQRCTAVGRVNVLSGRSISGAVLQRVLEKEQNHYSGLFAFSISAFLQFQSLGGFEISESEFQEGEKIVT